MKNLLKTVGIVILALLTIQGCATIDSVRPGAGAKFNITNRKYSEVWNAAIRTVTRSLTIVQQNKSIGVIKAEKGAGLSTWGEVVGVFIKPASDSNEYSIEVVSEKRSRHQITGQNWEQTIVSGIKAELEDLKTRAVSSDEDQEMWNMIKASNDAEDFKQYLKMFPNGQFRRVAKFKIGKLSSTTNSSTQETKKVESQNKSDWTGKWTSFRGMGGKIIGNLTLNNHIIRGDIMASGSPCFKDGTLYGTIENDSITIKVYMKKTIVGIYSGHIFDNLSKISGTYEILLAGRCKGDKGKFTMIQQ